MINYIVTLFLFHASTHTRTHTHTHTHTDVQTHRCTIEMQRGVREVKYGLQVIRQNLNHLLFCLYGRVYNAVLKVWEDWVWQILRISRLWWTALAKGLCPNLWDRKHPWFCRRTRLRGRCVHSERVREIGRRWVREEVVTDSWHFVVYSGLDR